MQTNAAFTQVRGTLTLADFLRLYYFLTFYAALHLPIMWIMSFFFPSPVTWMMLGYSAWLLYVPYRMASSVLGKHLKTGEEITQTFDANGIHSATAESSSELAWSVVEKVIETHSMYVLRIGQASAFPVPKRFFETPQIEDEFKAILKQYIRNEKFEPAGPLGRLL